jgi:hypothetical protein
LLRQALIRAAKTSPTAGTLCEMPIDIYCEILHNKMIGGIVVKNTGIPYEILTQTIFNEIVNQNSVETINVQHDVILQGRDAKHQIDVYWEFRHGNITYYTIIQAKDWTSPVKQEQLFAFKQVLQDLPNQPRGIFVTKTGYQKGALDFAKANGIELFSLREFTDEDAKGRIKTIVFNIVAYMPHSEVKGIEHDKNWISNYMKDRDIKGEVPIGIAGDPEKTFVLNENAENVESIKGLIDKLYPEDLVELPRTTKEICFSYPAFLKTTSAIIPLIKINKLFVEIYVGKTTIENRMEFDDIISFILTNVITKEEKLIKDDLTLLR